MSLSCWGSFTGERNILCGCGIFRAGAEYSVRVLNIPCGCKIFRAALSIFRAALSCFHSSVKVALGWFQACRRERANKKKKYWGFLQPIMGNWCSKILGEYIELTRKRYVTWLQAVDTKICQIFDFAKERKKTYILQMKDLMALAKIKTSMQVRRVTRSRGHITPSAD